MSEQLTGIEEKLIEFATKASATIQSQSEQIHALTHALLIALVSMSEKNPSFRDDFLERIMRRARTLAGALHRAAWQSRNCTIRPHPLADRKTRSDPARCRLSG